MTLVNPCGARAPLLGLADACRTCRSWPCRRGAPPPPTGSPWPAGRASRWCRRPTTSPRCCPDPGAAGAVAVGRDVRLHGRRGDAARRARPRRRRRRAGRGQARGAVLLPVTPISRYLPQRPDAPYSGARPAAQDLGPWLAALRRLLTDPSTAPPTRCGRPGGRRRVHGRSRPGRVRAVPDRRLRTDRRPAPARSPDRPGARVRALAELLARRPGERRRPGAAAAHPALRDGSCSTCSRAASCHGTTHTCLGQEYVPVALRAAARPGRPRVQQPPRSRPLPGPVRRPARPARRDHGPGGRGLRRRRRQPAHPPATATCPPGCRARACRSPPGSRCTSSGTEPGALACVYIGDGTWGEGAVYEALNLAALWRLPLLVVVEHNGIAQSTPTARADGGHHRRPGRGVRHPAHTLVVSTDVNDIRRRLAPLVARVRGGAGRWWSSSRTHRLGPHSKGDDTRPAGARTGRQGQRLVRPLRRTTTPSSSHRLDGRCSAQVARASPTRSPPARSAAGRTDRERVAENLNARPARAAGRRPGAYMLGEDILDPYGGAFKVTRGLSTRFPGPGPRPPRSARAPSSASRPAWRWPATRRSSRSCSATSWRSPSTSSCNFASKSVSMYGSAAADADGRALPDRRRPRLRPHAQPEPAEALHRHARPVAVRDVAVPRQPRGVRARCWRGASRACSSRTRSSTPADAPRRPVPCHTHGRVRRRPHRRRHPSRRLPARRPRRPDRSRDRRDAHAAARYELSGRLLVPARLRPLDLDPLLPAAAAARQVIVVEDGPAGRGVGTEVAYRLQTALWARQRARTALSGRRRRRSRPPPTWSATSSCRRTPSCGPCWRHAHARPQRSKELVMMSAGLRSGRRWSAADDGMTEILVPKLNANDTTYTLVEWIVPAGATVGAGDPVATVETSKATELPSRAGGVLHRVLPLGAECEVGAVIGRRRVGGGPGPVPGPGSGQRRRAGHHGTGTAGDGGARHLRRRRAIPRSEGRPGRARPRPAAPPRSGPRPFRAGRGSSRGERFRPRRRARD